jgi:hypothetical protein
MWVLVSIASLVAVPLGLTLGLVAVVVTRILSADGQQSPVRIIQAPPPPPTPTQTAPAGEAQQVHAALHDIGDWCRTTPSRRAQTRLDHDADLILTFARRYPEATFPIDDETGRALTLLMTTRQALSTCSPAAAARVGRALPRQFMNTPTAPNETTAHAEP